MVDTYLNFLGLKVRDKVTRFEGIITSVAFDLYGCVQGLITPLSKEGQAQEESCWMDMQRLEILNNKPVMPLPDFKEESIHGPEKKPII